ncbi:neutral/alkaline non-lysosomal ceramidase N-terminal domain-containing protein [Paenibacillus sp. GCM10027626]|uniref:neutral/alkaline non-lysosomal ceramidase N-terminal domain-containing protein n=1 Tax=Paenibacillus sp. GCM10027626 TaxID=3273411 RepID=UPI0036299920
MQTKLGSAKADITPLEPLPLAGFGSRKGNNEGVAQRLYLRVFLFEQEGEQPSDKRRMLLTEADILQWPSDKMEEWRRTIKIRWGIEPDAVILQASHTHGGPQTGTNFLPMVGHYSPSFVNLLESKLFSAIEQACANIVPVTAEIGYGKCGIGIHRRRLLGGYIEMLPDDTVPIDREVTAIRFRTEEGSTKAVLFHFTCHPTSSAENRVTADYPGVAMETVGLSLGEGAIVGFLQGCCGDIRPALIEGDRFRRGTDTDSRRLGNELAAEVLHILQSPMEQLNFLPIQATGISLELPYQSVPSAEELEKLLEDDGVDGEWSRHLRDYPERLQPTLPFRITLVQVADRLSFMAMSGEMVNAYGEAIKRISGRRALPLAYSNGLIGYVPTASQIREGGYESVGSVKYFGLPAPFAECIEEELMLGITNLWKPYLNK